jgi:Lysyl oxidase/von Willebrand factor type A domain
MGPNLTPEVRNFRIEPNFTGSQHEIDEGCVPPGVHRVLRFDFLSKNVGDAEFVVGRPIDRPDLFEYDAAHQHYHMRQFNQYKLYDALGNLVVPSKKAGFCLIDVEKVLPSAGPRKYTNCAQDQVMGISPGWADVYDASLPCQYLVIDGVPDGDYTVLATTNTGQVVPEDTFDDNTICQGLRIQGDNVPTLLPNPPIHVDLTTPTVLFNDVPESETAVRPVEFEVRSCGPVSFSVVSGPDQLTGPTGNAFGVLTSPGSSLTHDQSMLPRNAFLWLTYKGTTAGDTATGEVRVACNETGQQWTVPIVANTIKRPKVAVILVLDQSGSMNRPAGTGVKRIQVLHDAASRFVQLANATHGIGLVRFDDKASLVDGVLPLTTASNRSRLVSDITSTLPRGATSIGNGLELARSTIDPVTGYDNKAIVVFTDGLENTSKFISDVKDLITDRTFAIGLGTAQQVSTSALSALTKDTGGYLLVSGALSAAVDDFFRLSKYFLQILAAVTNTSIVKDPSGHIIAGQEIRIPFTLTSTDIEATIILMTDMPIVQLALETPAGHVLGPAEALSQGAEVVVGTNMLYYRVRLPLEAAGKPAHVGVWHALLSIGHREPGLLDNNNGTSNKGMARYSVSVQAYSNARMAASLTQDSFEPGAKFALRTSLTESGVPLADRAKVWAQVLAPGATRTKVWLKEIDPGVFQAEIVASLAGVYQCHVLCNGLTHHGQVFTREQLLTGIAVIGGNAPGPTTAPPDHGGDLVCSLLECFLNDQGVGRFLKERSIDPGALQHCVKASCADRHKPPSASELAEREGVAPP